MPQPKLTDQFDFDFVSHYCHIIIETKRDFTSPTSGSYEEALVLWLVYMFSVIQGDVISGPKRRLRTCSFGRKYSLACDTFKRETICFKTS